MDMRKSAHEQTNPALGPGCCAQGPISSFELPDKEANDLPAAAQWAASGPFTRPPYTAHAAPLCPPPPCGLEGARPAPAGTGPRHTCPVTHHGCERNPETPPSSPQPRRLPTEEGKNQSVAKTGQESRQGQAGRGPTNTCLALLMEAVLNRAPAFSFTPSLTLEALSWVS